MCNACGLYFKLHQVSYNGYTLYCYVIIIQISSSRKHVDEYLGHSDLLCGILFEFLSKLEMLKLQMLIVSDLDQF